MNQIVCGDFIDLPSVKPIEFSEDDLRLQKELVALYQNPDGTLTELGDMVRLS